MGNVVRESVEGIGISKLPDTLGNPAIFTEVAIPEIVKIPEVKPDIEQLLSVMVDAKIVSLRIIDTPEGTSNEGQILTGKKLSIELLLKQKIKYIADEPTQSVHAAHFEHVVNSLWVIVPKEIGHKKIENILREGNLVVTPYIEDIYGEQMDKRTIFKNITVLIHVTSPCLSISPADIKLLKAVNNNHVKVGDTITYTVVARNSGSIKATSVLLKDPLSSYVSFVAGSVKVDGTSTADNPTTTGVSLGDINPNISKVVTFNATIDSIPPSQDKIKNTSVATYNYIDTDGTTHLESSTSNTVMVTAEDVKLGIIKTGPGTVVHGNNITYTIVIKNEGTVPITDILFTDPLTNSGGATAAFVTDSFRINGAYTAGDPTTASINIGSLSPGDSVTISFDALSSTPGTVKNTAKTTYKYNFDPCGPTQNGSENSTEVTTTIS